MPPNIKKNFVQCRKGASELKKGKRTEEEKENNLRSTGTKCTKKLTKLQPLEKKVEADKLFLSSSTPPTDDCSNSQTNIKLKHPGFWSKKLQDLEENETKNKKHGLYEFSGTDESDTSYKIAKKPKQKARPQKKRQAVMSKYKKATAKTNKILECEKKNEQVHEKTLCREKIMLIKERKQLADEGKKFTFSINMQSLGITSTPALDKDNLIGASNFLFLSPICKKEECCDGVMEHLPPTLTAIEGSTNLGTETPKVQTKLKRISCRRVLRNRKMLDT